MYGTHQSLTAVHTILRKNDNLYQVIPSIMYAGIGITLFEMMWKESPWMYWFWECISPY